MPLRCKALVAKTCLTWLVQETAVVWRLRLRFAVLSRIRATLQYSATATLGLDDDVGKPAPEKHQNHKAPQL